MVQPVDRDARGILEPASGGRVFSLARYDAAEPLRRFVDRYWVARWEVSGAPYVQRLLTHPVVNITIDATGAFVHGVKSGVTEQELSGDGVAFGIMFRPAGFRPFISGPLSSLTDRVVPLGSLFGDTNGLVAAVGLDDAAMVRAADAFLADYAPSAPQASEVTTQVVDRIAAQHGVGRVKEVAALAGTTTRQLQRRFNDHVGLGPKAVLRRYRFYEAAERARRAGDDTWAATAAALGYSDQSHLTREFSELTGSPPRRYARRQRPAARSEPQPGA